MIQRKNVEDGFLLLHFILPWELERRAFYFFRFFLFLENGASFVHKVTATYFFTTLLSTREKKNGSERGWKKIGEDIIGIALPLRHGKYSS